MPYYPSAQHPSAPSPCFADSVLSCKMKDCPSRAGSASQLPACLLSALSPSSSCPLPSSLSSSSLPPCFGCGPAEPSICQPPDRELTWTLDTVPARLTRLFAQSRVDNSSSTITSAGADHVWNREGFNAVTGDGEGGERGTATLRLCIPQSHQKLWQSRCFRPLWQWCARGGLTIKLSICGCCVFKSQYLRDEIWFEIINFYWTHLQFVEF